MIKEMGIWILKIFNIYICVNRHGEVLASDSVWGIGKPSLNSNRIDYIHLRANILGKGIYALLSPAMGK